MQANVRMTILFEDEIRVAAKALQRFVSLLRENADEQECQAAAHAAMSAALVALNGAEDEGAVLLLGRKPSVTAGVREDGNG